MTFQIIEGNAFQQIQILPMHSIDIIFTNPTPAAYEQQIKPHMKQAERTDIIGTEDSPSQYIDNLVRIFNNLADYCKPSASLWIAIGDERYQSDNRLCNIPGRFAEHLQLGS